MLASFIAAVFVVLWSTGFVVARAITPYADPNLFLLARFGGTALIFALAAVAARAAWPRGRDFGKPGLRPIYHPSYYGAFVLDPDGNNLEAVFHGK